MPSVERLSLDRRQGLRATSGWVTRALLVLGERDSLLIGHRPPFAANAASPPYKPAPRRLFTADLERDLSAGAGVGARRGWALPADPRASF